MTRLEWICWFTGSAACVGGTLVLAGAPQIYQSGWAQAGMLFAFLSSTAMSILVHDALTKSHLPDDTEPAQERERLP